MNSLYAKLATYLDDKFFYRFCVFSILIMLGGIHADRNWHTVNPIRDHYFIIPHVIVYIGIVSTMFGFLVLKLRKYKLSLFLFILFPIFSMFDDFWHKLYGVELITSPMSFWSPAHWSLYLVFLYIVCCLYYTKIEDNKYVLLFVKALMFILPVKTIWYVLVPVSPFTRYPELFSNNNIVFAVLSVLIIFTAYKVFKDKDVLFISLLLLYSNTSSTNLLSPGNYIYKNAGMMLIFYSIIFIFLIFDKLSIKYYLLMSYLTLIWVFIMTFLVRGIFYLSYFVYSLVVVTAFVTLYFYCEEYLLNRFEKQLITFRKFLN